MSLKEKLDAYKAEFQKKAGPEKVEIMHRATEELRQSGIVERVLRAGAKMPEFALANTRGETVRSADLLAKGKLVVTFYRGVW